MQNPTALAPALPTDLEHRLRAPSKQPLGMFTSLCLTALLWAAMFMAWNYWQQTPMAPARAPMGELRVYQSATKTQLILAMEQPASRTTPRANGPLPAQQLADAGVLMGHVAQTLLRDQFDSVILKLSLGTQVVGHLQQRWQE